MDRPSPDVLAVGETMALFVPDPVRPLEQADAFALHVAGAESNVAIALARRGVRSSWAGAVGGDPLGRRVLRELHRHGVDVGYAVVDAGAPTGVFLKDPDPAGTRVHYYRARSATSRLTADFAERLPLDAARLVHLSGITPALSQGCARLVEAILVRRRASGLPVSFDVNFRPALWEPGRAAGPLRRLARRSDLVFVGRDEAETLWGASTAEQIRDLIPEPRLVVKDGAIGAHLFDGDTRTFVPAAVVDVVEPVGAGDAFAAGFIAAQLAGEGAESALEHGHRAAALALVTAGDLAEEK